MSCPKWESLKKIKLMWKDDNQRNNKQLGIMITSLLIIMTSHYNPVKKSNTYNSYIMIAPGPTFPSVSKPDKASPKLTRPPVSHTDVPSASSASPHLACQPSVSHPWAYSREVSNLCRVLRRREGDGWLSSRLYAYRMCPFRSVKVALKWWGTQTQSIVCALMSVFFGICK